MEDPIKSDEEVKIETNTKTEDEMDKTDMKPKNETETSSEKKLKNNSMKKWLLIALAILLIGTAAGGTWWYMNKKAKDDSQKDKDKISSLEKQASDKDSELAKAKSDLEAAKKNSSTTTTTTTSAPSAATLENIKASVESKNTAALEGYMNPTVNVIIAASECCGARTPTQAINDMNYLNNATMPWNFALPAATLAQYRAGDYKQYFPTDALIGKSANGYVVSFSFSLGKISTVFMSVNGVL